MIEARDITFRVRERTLLDRVSFAAAPGSVTCLVGPNGAGKSTLLRVLSGDVAPSAGEVEQLGAPLSRTSLVERARVRAVLPQHSTCPFEFSAGEVVLLGRTPHHDGSERLIDRTIARAAMVATDTLHLEDRIYPSLSGGEAQRVQLARVLAQVWEGSGPRVLLLDEPTSSLDVSHQHLVMTQMRRMAERGCAVVGVVHDLNLAARYADVIVVLAEGRIHSVGSPSAVLTVATLRNVFDVEALVLDHPQGGCPLVVPLGKAEKPFHRTNREGDIFA